MKQITNYIEEALHLNKDSGKNKYTCQPKDKKELKSIIKKRLETNKDADLNDIDVSNVTSMTYLFDGLDPHKIDISEWNVSNVKWMTSMFNGCENFNSDLSNWDVSKVKDMAGMFFGCKKFNSDLSNWNVSNVKNMFEMFVNCRLLKNKPSWYKK